MAIRVTLECGHASMLRVRTTPEGYTHDWEVFVRGVDNADISQYIDKVVFNLHETFQKPKRILKEPPYIVKESGYAGFEIPIDVYLKNKDEPKRIQIQYDLHLQQSGPAINNVIRHHEVIPSPSEEFRKKLLKGGGVVSHAEDSTEKGEFKMVPPMVSKPKLSGTDVKKHRMTEVRSSDEFSDLFGNIMTLPAKVSPDNKRALSDKIISSKPSLEKSEKTEKSVKQKHSPHKDKKKDKNSDERKDKKDRLPSKEKDRAKEKSKRPPSPMTKEDLTNSSVKKPNSIPSPSKKHVGPPPVSTATQRPPSPRPKEKQHKKASSDKEKDKVKDNFKVPVEEQTYDRKKKKHKEDKNKDRKERSDKESKEHDKNKDSQSKGGDKKLPKPEKHGEKSDKEKNQDCKISKDEKKSPKHSKDRDRVRSEKSSRSETLDKIKEPHTDREKQKHKHKRKDKKEKKEEKDAEKERQEKQKTSSDKKNSFGGLSSAANPLSTLLAEMPERDSSDSTHSVDEESMPPTSKAFFTAGSETEVVANPPTLSSDITKQPSPSRNNVEVKNVEGEERTKEKKEKTKSSSRSGEDRESRKRKRKGDSGSDEHVVKREKDREPSLSPSVEPVSSSQSPVSIDVNSPYISKESAPPPQTEILNITESEQVAPDSTNGNFIEPEAEGALVFSDDYVSQLKELQQKIMTLQDNHELQRVVQVIAETGQYEITRKTFDFDLCALDRTTVQRLQQFFSAS